VNEKEQLAGQVAVVTGGSGAIGSAIICALQKAGAKAISLDLVAPRDKDIAWVSCDVRETSSVAQALERVFQLHKRIDLLIHGAGVSRDAVVWKLGVEDWDFVQQVNLRGAFLLMHHGVPLLRLGSGGRIVLIGSINGSRGKFGTSAYSASKAGLLGLAKSVARETARFGVLVNVVEPGWVRTPLTEAVSAEVREAAVKESLLGKLLEPGDVAAAVVFLCGPGANHITGQILRVDGGQFLGPS
jgi:3-oxoacyl-[acyl-carrier protein] reductase